MNNTDINIRYIFNENVYVSRYFRSPFISDNVKCGKQKKDTQVIIVYFNSCVPSKTNEMVTSIKPSALHRVQAEQQ